MMAIGWLTILQSVPWSDVIANAPKVADGARKLWSTVSRKPAPPPPQVEAPGAAGEDTLAALRAQVAALQAEVAEFQDQMLASSGLIKALADQNAQLVARIETLRRRALRALAVLALVALGAAAGVVVLALRSQGS